MELRASDLRLAAMDLLARREHSSQEITMKLKRRFRKQLDNDDLVLDVVDQLIDQGLISNERYAASMARQLVSRGSGPSKVAYELRQKGCDADAAVQEAFPDGIDWFAAAEDVYDRKFGQRPMPREWDEKRKEQAKRGRFMASRGFSPSHFMHLINEATD